MSTHPSTHPRALERTPLTDADWQHLAAVRAGIRRYLAWAEQRASEHGMTPAQVQLALAIRSHPEPSGPTLSELAATLLLRHNSVVGLVDRAVRAGLVRRERDPVHLSRVHVLLTDEGEQRLEALSRLHLDWLGEHGAEHVQVWGAFD